MIRTLITEDDIQKETNLSIKPHVYNLGTFPLDSLNDRQFEVLLYHLFKQRIKKGEFKNKFDNISLMQGVGEKGRDSVLYLKGQVVGLIQCKKKSKNLGEKEVIKEILKFVLNYLNDKTLISNPNKFTYYFSVSKSFTGRCISYLDSFNEQIINEPNLRNWTEEVINEFESLKNINYTKIEKKLKNILSKITVEKCLSEDTNFWLNNNEEVINNFFTIRSVADNSYVKKVLDKVESIILPSHTYQPNISIKLRSKLSENRELFELWKSLQIKFIPYLQNINDNFKDFIEHDYTFLEDKENTLGLLISEKVISILNYYEIFSILFCLCSSNIGLGANDKIINSFCFKNNISIPADKCLFLIKYQSELTLEILEEIIDSYQIQTISNMQDILLEIIKAQRYNNLELVNITDFIGNNIINTTFISVLVKLSDLLELSKNLFPVSLLNLKGVGASYSIKEVDYLKNSALHITLSEQNTAINMMIVTRDINAFKLLNDYIEITKKEFDYCAALFTKKNISQNGLNLNTFNIIQTKSKTPFVDEVIMCDIDKSSAISTLIGRNLYDDDSIFIRELIQNCVDACYIRKLKNEFNFNPIIKVHYDSLLKKFEISDNGIGMDLNDLKYKLFLSCSKGFRDIEKSDELISKFGIGFLSIFMVSKDIIITTKQFDSYSNEAFQVKVKNYDQPIEINKIKCSNIGTTIILNIDKEVNLTKDIIIKWLTLQSKDYLITFSYDNEDLSSEISNKKPKTTDPELNFVEKIFFYECSEYEVYFRAWSLFKNSKFVSSCGLSFQRDSHMPNEIISLPDLKKKIYYKGIPLKRNDEEGYAPSYNTSKYKPIFTELHCPLSLNIKKPGIIDLNISRNEFIKSEKNSKFFNNTDIYIAKLLKDYFNWLNEKGIEKSKAAFDVLSQYWVYKLAERAKIPSDLSTEESYNNNVYHELSDIWININCRYLNKDGSTQVMSFRESYFSNKPTLYIDQRYIEWTRIYQGINCSDLIKILDKIMSKNFPQGYLIMTEIDNNHENNLYKKSISPFSFLRSIALNCAFLDLSETELGTTPLVIYSFKKNILPESSTSKIALYGSDKPIGGFWERFLGNGQSTGGGYFYLFYNVLNKNKEFSFIEDKFNKFEEPRYLGFNKFSNQMFHTREIFSEFLKNVNNGNKFDNKFISPCLDKKITMVSYDLKTWYI